MYICFSNSSGVAGVARGCGWQHQVVFINLGSFYFIGIPVATILAFKFQLHAKVHFYRFLLCFVALSYALVKWNMWCLCWAQGLWIGLTCGLAAQTIGLLLLSKFTKWRRIEFSQDCWTTFSFVKYWQMKNQINQVWSMHFNNTLIPFLYNRNLQIGNAPVLVEPSFVVYTIRFLNSFIYYICSVILTTFSNCEELFILHFK